MAHLLRETPHKSLPLLVKAVKHSLKTAGGHRLNRFEVMQLEDNHDFFHDEVIGVRRRVTPGADTIAVACPMCRAMLEDAVKNLDTPLEVRHISELAGMAL